MRIKNARPFPTALTFGKTGEGAPFLSVIVKGTFELRDGGRARPAETQLPILTSDEAYNPKDPASALELESDLVPFKPRTDVILVGHAYAPYGRPAKVVDVEIEVGPLRKHLRVFGDRAWSFPSAQADAVPYVVGPAEFVKMPLTWDRAFGGIDKAAAIRPGNPPRLPWCERNYLGRGFCGARSVASIDKTPLPNVEDPDDLIRSWDHQPRPAGCGFFPRNSRPRADWWGTFDEKWQADRKPQLPLDFRFDAYNGADLTMQLAPYLLGDELVRLTNVSPQAGQLRLGLPGLTPSVQLQLSGQARRVPANLDTVVLLPDSERLYLVWRAIVAGVDETSTEPEKLDVEYAELPSQHEQAHREPLWRRE